jgi:hypothetical protein
MYDPKDAIEIENGLFQGQIFLSSQYTFCNLAKMNDPAASCRVSDLSQRVLVVMNFSNRSYFFTEFLNFLEDLSHQFLQDEDSQMVYILAANYSLRHTYTIHAYQ